MSFKDIPIFLTYETGKDDPVNDFYIPTLSNAQYYDRIAGFFSSTSLAIAARGIAGFIKNQGKMRLIASPILNDQDSNTIHQAYSEPEKFISEKFLQDLEQIEDEIKYNHLQALGWMDANRRHS